MNTMSIRHRVMVLAGMAALLVLGIFFAQAVIGNNPDWAPDSDMVARGPVMDSESYQRSLAEKQALEEQEERARERARSEPMTAKGRHTPPPGKPTEPVPTGILKSLSLPSGWGRIYRIENAWQHFANGERIVVYAGSRADDPIRSKWNDPEQGVVVVMVFSAVPDVNPITQEYLTPGSFGRMRIMAANGMQLTLASTTGSSKIVFDVATRAFAPR